MDKWLHKLIIILEKLLYIYITLQPLNFVSYLLLGCFLNMSVIICVYINTMYIIVVTVAMYFITSAKLISLKDYSYKK